MKAFWDPVQLRHAPRFFLQRGQLRANFEVPGRAEALLGGLATLGIAPTAPGQADLAAVRTVHDAAYLDFLRDAPAAWAALPDAGPEIVPNMHPTPEMLAQGARPSAVVIGQAGWFVPDNSTPVTADTWASAIAAAACALAAADEASAGRHAYALCRPPGHHAYGARAGGHCFLNNAAIAAERLRARGAARVGVLDVDSHHGNGTQGIFWERGDVAFASVHGDPNGYYPWYVGHADEHGGGAGAGATHNMPLPRGSGDAAWLEAVDAGLAAMSGVDALVLSLGFDASVDEPLNYLSVSDDGFARMAERVAGFGVPVAIVQEGGYNLDRLGPLLARTLPAFG